MAATARRVSQDHAHPPYASRWTEVDGHQVHFLEAGTDPDDPHRPTLVLLHGFGGWAEVAWAGTLQRFSATHRVLAPDIPGFGRSDRVEPHDLHVDGDPVEPTVGFVEAFLDDQGVDRCTLVGNSWGGAVALTAALEVPERVERLVLVDSAGLGRSVHPVFKAMGLPGIGHLLVNPTRGQLRHFWNLLTHRDVDVPREVIEENLRYLDEPGSVEVMRAARHGVNLLGQKHVLVDELPRVEAPTLVVWGEDDTILPLRHGERAVSHLPHGEFAVLPRCGHLPPFERPDAFNATLARFLLPGTA